MSIMSKQIYMEVNIEINPAVWKNRKMKYSKLDEFIMTESQR